MKCKHKNFAVEYEGDQCPVCETERKLVSSFLIWTHMPPPNERTAAQKDILERLRGDDWRQAERDALVMITGW